MVIINQFPLGSSMIGLLLVSGWRPRDLVLRLGNACHDLPTFGVSKMYLFPTKRPASCYLNVFAGMYSRTARIMKINIADGAHHHATVQQYASPFFNTLVVGVK
jgi:hypothetical protein